MIPQNRADYLARIDGLSSELLRLSVYSKQHLTPKEATSFQAAIRSLSQWCAHMHNDKIND